MASKLLTLSEAADRLNIPDPTLRLWVHKGYGPTSAKIGRRRMWREADVDRWIDAQFVEAAS